MTIHGTDLILILTSVAAASVASYLILLRKLRQIVSERHLTIADQMAALDDSIHALETRLATHHATMEMIAAAQGVADSDQPSDFPEEESAAVAPEIQAVIAASAVAALGQDIHIRSIKPVTSSWSQQGRVLVQGSHNARARR